MWKFHIFDFRIIFSNMYTLYGVLSVFVLARLQSNSFPTDWLCLSFKILFNLSVAVCVGYTNWHRLDTLHL